MLFLEASAKTGDNVEEGFVTTAGKVLDLIKDGVFDLKDEVNIDSVVAVILCDNTIYLSIYIL